VLSIYAFIADIEARGGSIFIQEDTGELTRLKII